MALNINGTTGISGVDGSASAPALQGSDSNTGVSFGTDILAFNIGGSEKARIHSNGNFGVNSTNPLTQFVVQETDGGTGIEFSMGASESYIQCYSRSANDYKDLSIAAENIRFRVNANTEVIKLSSDGTFDLKNSTYAYFQSNSTSTSSLTLRKSASGADNIDYLQCRNSSNTLKMQVQGSGDVNNSNNTYGSLSDNKLKENIVDAKSQWDDIKNVKVRNFNFKDDSAKTKMLGVVAQEIEIISSGLVSESIDRNPDTGEDLGTKTKAVKYSILYMKAIKCLQEAQARIETLETEKTKLQTDLTALTARVTTLEAG